MQSDSVLELYRMCCPKFLSFSHCYVENACQIAVLYFNYIKYKYGPIVYIYMCSWESRGTRKMSVFVKVGGYDYPRMQYSYIYLYSLW
jgi:hypothetical protein